MKPWHLAVIVALPQPLREEVDGLRRALGDRLLGRVPAHLTLVPPVTVAAIDLPAALGVMRSAAAGRAAFEIGIGPPATFAPLTPTVHLAVLDPSGALASLRSAVFKAPLSRQTFPYVPHVTLLAEAPQHVIHAARTLLRHYQAPLKITRMALVAEHRDADGVRRWLPVADVDLDGVRVVGRGGLALELATGSVVDPEAQEALGGPAPSAGLVVTGRREGAVAGMAWMGAEGEEVLVVAEAVRGQGIGRHLRDELRWRAAQQRAAAIR